MCIIAVIRAVLLRFVGTNSHSVDPGARLEDNVSASHNKDYICGLRCVRVVR